MVGTRIGFSSYSNIRKCLQRKKAGLLILNCSLSDICFSVPGCFLLREVLSDLWLPLLQLGTSFLPPQRDHLLVRIQDICRQDSRCNANHYHSE